MRNRKDMFSKLTRLFIAAIFIAGVSFSGLCIFSNPRPVSDCCSTKAQPVPTTSESCLSHCAKQKIAAIETEALRGQEQIIKAPEFFNISPSFIPNNGLFNPELFKGSYLEQEIPILFTDQVHSAAIFSRAPPLSL